MVSTYLTPTAQNLDDSQVGELWADILVDPDLDLEKAIASKMEPLAQQLDRTLSG